MSFTVEQSRACDDRRPQAFGLCDVLYSWLLAGAGSMLMNSEQLRAELAYSLGRNVDVMVNAS
jgi:hypothetical protein